jgi:hypothetical protein
VLCRSDLVAPVIARSETTKQSQRWDRPARNAGLPVIRHPGPRSGVKEMAGRDARCYQIVGTGRDAHPAGDCFAALAMTTSAHARLNVHVYDGSRSSFRKSKPAHSARIRDVLQDSLAVELLLQFHDSYREPR